MEGAGPRASSSRAWSARLLLLAAPMGAAAGLGILVVLAHVRPTLPRHGGGPLGSFVGVFVVACATAIALAYRRLLLQVTGWRAVVWLALWLGLLLVEYFLL